MRQSSGMIVMETVCGMMVNILVTGTMMAYGT